MDASTLVLGLTALGIVVTVLIAWFKSAKTSNLLKDRIVVLENDRAKFASKEHVDEQFSHFREKADAFEGRIRADVAEIAEAVEKINTDCCDNDREIVRMQEFIKSLEMFKNKIMEVEALRAEFLEKFTRRGDFIREMQILSSSIQATHQKIDHLEDQIVDRLRSLTNK